MFKTLRNLINTQQKLEQAEQELEQTLRALQKVQKNLKVESEIKDTIISNKLAYIKVLERKIRDRWAKEDANTFLVNACCMSKS